MVFFNRHTHGAFGIRLNEILTIWPSEKNHKTSLSGGISTSRKLEKLVKFFCLKIGQNERISLNLIPNAPWVCLSENTIPVPDSFHGGYTPPEPNCEGALEESQKNISHNLSFLIEIIIKLSTFSEITRKT